jgi:hypothetical protein
VIYNGCATKENDMDKACLKEAIFWVTFIPMGVILLALYMAAAIVNFLANGYDDLICAWESWCLGYKKDGWIRSNGLWVKRPK